LFDLWEEVNMAKFKAGDRVRIKSNDVHPLSPHYKKGDTAIYLGADRFEMSDGNFQWVTREDRKEEIFNRIKRGRPSKSKPVKFIAKYIEDGGDPYKEFTSKKALNEWLKGVQEDNHEDIEFNSIKIYEIKKEFGVETSFRLKEKK